MFGFTKYFRINKFKIGGVHTWPGCHKECSTETFVEQTEYVVPNENVEVPTTTAQSLETTVTTAVPRSELTATTSYTTVKFDEPMDDFIAALAICKGQGHNIIFQCKIYYLFFIY